MKLKRLLSIILAVLMLLCISAAAFAEDNTETQQTESEDLPSPNEEGEIPQEPVVQASTPTPTTDNIFKITKDPTNENVIVGGKIVFIAHAQNSISIQWFIVSKDGNSTISADGMSALYQGVSVSGCYEDTLVINNATLALNGCSAFARYSYRDSSGDEIKTKDTQFAKMTVTAATPTPTATPTATPIATPTPVPEATPIATAQLQPVDEPEATETPSPIPTESPEEESNSGHSGIIAFLLIIGVILLGTAVVLILYVKGVIKLDWLEEKLGGNDEETGEKK